jgi:uncharacterized protein (DUF58 family)
MAQNTDVDSLLDESFLQQLERLRLLAQRGITGQTRGEHVAWRSGTSLEFLDFRKYQLGDDFRYIDWNIYGRLDKLFIKLFHAEEDRTIHILLDSSASMGFGKPSKDLVAKKLAAALSYIGLSNLDRVGVISFARELGEALLPARGKQVYLSVLKYLQYLAPESETDFNSCLTEYAVSCKRPGIAIVLSDLMDPKGVEKGLAALTYAKFDVALIQVLDKEELSPSSSGHLIIKDVETGESKTITLDEELATLYKQRLQDFNENIREFCLKRGIGYYLYNTSIPFEQFLLDYLTRGTLLK